MGKVVGLAVLVLLVLVVIFGGWFFGSYNKLVGLDEDVKVAWSQVENVYQRRMDLIPNLVETVKGAADFEKETYTAVAEARANAGKIKLSSELLNDPNAFAQFERTQGELSSALSRLLVTVERYPDLKATANFADLQTQLEGTENRIAIERKRFNDVAGIYNKAIRQFPARFVAAMTGFDQRPYFQATPGADQAPKVEF